MFFDNKYDYNKFVETVVEEINNFKSICLKIQSLNKDILNFICDNDKIKLNILRNSLRFGVYYNLLRSLMKIFISIKKK